MLLSGASRGSSMEKFLSQKVHYETKSITELVTKHLMKFEKIDGYFPSLGKDGFAHIRNLFTANTQMLQPGTGTQKELVKLQYDGLHAMCILRNSYVNFWFMMCNPYKKLLHLLFKHSFCFHHHRYMN